MLDKNFIGSLLDEALSTGGDFAEIYVEDTESNALTMLGGTVYKASAGRDYGVGVRIFDGYNAIYAYTCGSDKEEIAKIVKKAAQALKKDGRIQRAELKEDIIDNIHIIQIPPHKIEKSKKVQLMTAAHKAAKSVDSLISQVSINYSDSKKHILVANSDGRFVEDDRTYVRMHISAVASKGNEMQTGVDGPGAHCGFEFFESLDVEEYARKAARTAVTMIHANYCPGGRMPVVLANGFGGVIFHEACGHGLEATSVAKGNSVFAGKVGQKVANEKVTAIDDGTIPNAWGSTNIDDEGTPTQKRILIENGILKGYMIDLLNARRMNAKSTGSGRRQNFRYAPTSRMSNTYIAPGSDTFDEIIAGTEYGLYAAKMGGGSVNPSTGEFNFSVAEGYMIRNGKIAEPVRGATLIGKGNEVIQRIDMVGSDLAFGQGVCGSLSGNVPTNVGQPVIRVSEMIVGGRDGAQNG
ncbi:MAG: TldD/PmbA family protein [Clostridia bacterium]|jgi:TldD protein